MRHLHESPATEARKIRAHFDASSTSEPPANRNSIPVGGWRLDVTMPAGSNDSRTPGTWAELQQTGSSPRQTTQVTPQNYSLPLQLCTRKQFTVIDYSKYTTIPHGIPKHFVLSSEGRKQWRWVIKRSTRSSSIRENRPRVTLIFT